MTPTIADQPKTRSPDGALLFFGLLLAQLAPGVLVTLALTGNITAALILGVIGGMIVGYPFAFLVFAPTILVLGRYWRLTWWSLALAGFLSVLAVGVAHCIVQSHLASGFSTDLLLAACSGAGAYFFWLIVGDFCGDDRG